MNRSRKAILLSILFSISYFLSTTLILEASDSENANVYHVVICWLKDPGNDSQRQKLIEETKKLQSIPGIVSIQVGNMLPSNRPIVDSSYDIGIIMSFKDETAMNRYLQDPTHQKATKEILTPLTSKIIVYDFVAK